MVSARERLFCWHVSNRAYRSIYEVIVRLSGYALFWSSPNARIFITEGKKREGEPGAPSFLPPNCACAFGAWRVFALGGRVTIACLPKQSAIAFFCFALRWLLRFVANPEEKQKGYRQ